MEERVGAYRLERRLGGGGMGVVYRAIHEPTGSVVALKTVEEDRGPLVASLRAEIDALSRLCHPGVVHVREHGVAHGRPFFAMDLLDGETLETAAKTLIFGRSQSLASQPTRRIAPLDIGNDPTVLEATVHQPTLVFDPERMARIAMLAIRLARALAYVHGEGIVHRDLKPDNIVILQGERPVLIDFGIAKARPVRSREHLELDREIVGTAAYVAPEQVCGEPPDPRSDLYALGCVLYRLLAERPPFVAKSAAAVLRAHVCDLPEPPSRHVKGLPPEVDALVLALLEKSPLDRVAYADDVISAFGRLGFHCEPEAAPAPRPYLYVAACVGRSDEIARASQIVDRGTGCVFTVVGESGVGKTRFLAELIRVLPTEMHVIASTCEPAPASGANRCALAPLLRHLVERARSDRTGAVARWIGPWAHVLSQIDPEITSLLDFGALPSLPPPERMVEATAEALRDVALAMANDGPLALAIDDIQWSDPATLRFVELLASDARLPATRLLVFAAYRAEEANRGWLARGLRSDAALAIELAPLPESAMIRAAGAMLGLRQGTEHLGGAENDAVRTMVDRAQNSPFALVELLRFAVEDGALVRAEQWSMGSSASPFWDASGKIADQVAALRLARLGPGPRAFVDALAILGRPSATLLAATVAFGEEVDLEPRAFVAHGELSRLRVISEAGPGEIVLTHDKLREAALRSMTEERARDLHGRVAQCLARPGAAKPEILSEIGQHEALAGHPEGACRAYLDAARAFEDRGAIGPWLECLMAARAASDGLAEEHPLVRRACAHLGGAYGSLGRVIEAKPLLERARIQSEQHQDDATLARTLGHLAYVAYLTGEGSALLEHASRAAEIAERIGDMHLLGRAENALGIAWGSSGHFRVAIRHYRRAAELAEATNDRASLGKHLSNISINHRLLGELDEALDAARKATVMTARSATTHSNAWSNLGRVCLERGDLDAADDAFGRAIDIASRFDYAVVTAEATWGRAEAARARGDLQKAEDLAGDVVALAEAKGFPIARAQAIRTLALVALERGQDGAIARLEESVAILEKTQEKDELADSLVALAAALERTGSGAAAALHLEEARRIYGELDMQGRLRALKGSHQDGV